MSVVSKLRSGFIYESYFDDIDSCWEISDLNRVSVNGGLHIECGDTPVYLYFNQLSNEKQFVLDVKNVYNPTKGGETGGIIVYIDEDNFISLEEYYDEEKGVANVYPWLRLIRDYNVYSGYWSVDGKNWVLIGTHDFGGLTPKIGLFLDGTTENMLIEYVRIFRSPYVTVINPPPRTSLQLVGIDGVMKQTLVPVHYPKVAFPISSLGIPLEAKFRWVISEEEIVETDYFRNMWGGDEFKFQISLDLYYKDGEAFKQVDSNEEEFLGYINSGGTDLEGLRNRDILMRLNNSHDYIFRNVSVTALPYKGDYDISRFVSMSLDKESLDTGTLAIDLGDIPPLTEKYFWVRICRAEEYETGIAEIYFSLDISSSIG